MTSSQFFRSFIAGQILFLVLVVGFTYAFREEIAYWLVKEAVNDDALRPTEKVLIKTTNELVIDTIESANPAVVSIVITKDVPIYEWYYEQLSPFGGLFGFEVPRIREKGTREQEVGGGSGFIVSEGGLVVTNRHVVGDEDARYSVLMNDGSSYPVSVVARDTYLDIAILQIEELPQNKQISYLQFGDSRNLKLGESVIAIGNALGEFRNSVSVGVVSGLSRSIIAGDSMGVTEELDEVIQTDAAINFGNSGGPLLNLGGEVVGVNVAVSLGAENIGFALPAHLVSGIVESVKEFGEIVRPYMGVRYVILNEQIAEDEDIDITEGALVVRGEEENEFAVLPNSPAQRAGIVEGDIILEIDGVKITSEKTLAEIIRTKRAGDTITVLLDRSGTKQTVHMTLERSPE